MRVLSGAALAAVVAVAPWLLWLPAVREPAMVALLGAVAIAGAWHGYGRALARLLGRDSIESALAAQWGVAVSIGIGGVMIALHVYDARLLVVAGLVAHTIDTLLAFTERRAAFEDALRFDRVRYWLVPAVLLALVAFVHLLGGAGAVHARSFDDDTNVTAQVARLASTGGLDDAIGFPRVMQLGGGIAVDSLVTAFGDPRQFPLLEALALVLVVWLACSRVGARDAASSIWCSLLVVAGSAFVVAWPDRLPLYLPVGLALAAVFTLADTVPGSRTEVALAVLGAALAVVRTELAPVGLTFVAAAYAAGRRPLRQDARRIALLAAVVVAIAGAYLISRSGAWSHVKATAHSLVEPRRGSVPIRLLLSILFAGLVAPLLLLAIPATATTRALRWFAFAFAAGIGGVAGKITSERIFGARMIWSLAIVAMIVLVVEVARKGRLDRYAFILATAICMLVYEGRSDPGRGNWSWRYWELMHDVEYARHVTGEGGDYEQLLSQVPRNERVAIWVTRPELVDYTRHDVIDVRTPRLARLRDPSGADPKFGKLLHAARASWLLFEIDDAYFNRRAGSWLHDALCPRGSRAPACTDALERLAFEHPPAAEQHGIVLVRL